MSIIPTKEDRAFSKGYGIGVTQAINQERKLLESKPEHPGVILKREFLEKRTILQKQLATDIHISTQMVCDLIKGRRDMNAKIALRLARYFKTTASFWMTLQSNYELSKELKKEQRDGN